MSILLSTFISSFASLLVAFYFLYRWVRQKPKNNSTLAWFLGFLVYSMTQAFSGILHSGLYAMPTGTYNNLNVIRCLLVNMFFMFIFWGTIRLIFRRRLIIYGVTILGFILANLIVIFANNLTNNDLNAVKLISYLIYLPAGIIFFGIFLVLYGVLVAESVKRKYGITLIIVSWLIYIILSLALPSLYQSHFDYWYLGRGISTLILLLGFIIMEREARQAFVDFNEDMKLHHHFK
ncbi:MAG: hypothetical protein ABIH38_03970 [Patescibacteria group bacterium]